MNLKKLVKKNIKKDWYQSELKFYASDLHYETKIIVLKKLMNLNSKQMKNWRIKFFKNQFKKRNEGRKIIIKRIRAKSDIKNKLNQGM